MPEHKLAKLRMISLHSKIHLHNTHTSLQRCTPAGLSSGRLMSSMKTFSFLFSFAPYTKPAETNYALIDDKVNRHTTKKNLKFGSGKMHIIFN